MARTPLEKARRAAAHPKRPGAKCNAEPGSWTPVVDHNRCEAKRDCVDVCPYEVFVVRKIDPDDFDALGFMGKLRVRTAGRGNTAYTPGAANCHACGLCVVACPEMAITLRPPVTV